MCAALALPNILPAPAQAVEIEEAAVQYGHYEESGRAFWPGPNLSLKPPAPLRVDMLRASTTWKLGDRLKLGMEFLQDTWSGATPYITTPEGFVAMTGASAYVAADKAAAAARVDRRTLTPLNLTGTPLVAKSRTVNLMTSASPETRYQARFALTREWDEAALGVSAALSEEPDYKSRTLGLSGRWDFNRKLTTVNAGFSHTASSIDASLGPASGFVDYGLYTNPVSGPRIVGTDAPGLVGGVASDKTQLLRFRGNRQDMSLSLGLTQVMGKNTVFSTTITHARSAGFLESPHKLVLMGFANPATPAFFNYLFTTLFAVPEKRPDVRNQTTWNARVSQYVPGANAALHVDYSHARDNWGVKSHTVEAKWVQPVGEWTITPRIRYYTQNAASFYQPYFVFRQRFPQSPASANALDFSRMPVEYWSSDQRLSGYGTRSLGLVVGRQLGNDVRLEVGLEEYLRAGWLKRGGGGDDGFADYRSKMLNVGLVFNLQGKAGGDERGHEHHHHDHGDHQTHAGGHAPAGVMNAHMMDQAGSLMVGYSYMFSQQGGRMLNGAAPASDRAIVAACGNAGCPATPRDMRMHMHMLHFMYAPAERVNLMFMPQVVSMTMANRILDGGYFTATPGHNHGDIDLSGHTTGGIGDTVASALVGVARWPGGALNLGMGVSIPTGSINKKMPSHGNALHDYGMQLGSGTWDLLPSLTYLGSGGKWSWGGQVSGVLRQRRPNHNGYNLGDILQQTAWIGYRLGTSLSVSLRAVHTIQGPIRGEMHGLDPVFDASGRVTFPRPLHNSTDVAGNYGGRFTDIGVGFSLALPGRESAGDRVGLEWLAPVRQQVSGYQLERKGSLAVNWSMMF